MLADAAAVTAARELTYPLNRVTERTREVVHRVTRVAGEQLPLRLKPGKVLAVFRRRLFTDPAQAFDNRVPPFGQRAQRPLPELLTRNRPELLPELVNLHD